MQFGFSSKRLFQILILSIIFIVSFSLRWGYIKNTSFVKRVPKDAYAYTMIAYNLANNHVFSSAKDPKGQSRPDARPPGYPMFLAGIVAITDSFDAFYITTLWIQSIIGALTVLLSYTLARFLFPGLWSFFPVVLVMISPHMITMSAYILSECLFTFMLLLSIIVFLFAFKSDKLISYGLAGIILSMAIFVRPVLGIFPILCSVIVFFLNSNKKRFSAFLCIVTFLVAAYSFQFSWSVWKHAGFGPDVVMVDKLKSALLSGTYPDLTFKNVPGMPHSEDPEYNTLMEKDYGDICFYIINTFKSDPVKYFTWWFFKKPTMFWSWKVFFSDGINFYPIYHSWFDINILMKTLRSIMLFVHPILVILAGLSILVYSRTYFRGTRSIETLCYFLCFALLVHFTIMFMILAPYPRYALPLGPELYLFSVIAIREIIQKSKSFKRKRNNMTLNTFR